MSQAFSLYGELTVEQNLTRPAVPRARGRRAWTRWPRASAWTRCATRCREPAHGRAPAPVAVAMVHKPELLILDEPTSGVDPVARDNFWRLLIALARQDQVTIFISTHFMNEAERCDMSLMHAARAGQRLARRDHARARRGHAGRGLHRLPDRRRRRRQATRRPSRTPPPNPPPRRPPSLQPAAHAELCVARSAGAAARPGARHAGAGRLAAVDVRHRLRHQPGRGRPALRGDGPRPDRVEPELRAEPVRLALLHRTSTRDDYQDMDARMRSGELSLAIEIPQGFARDVQRASRRRSACGSTAPCRSAPRPSVATCWACRAGWRSRRASAWASTAATASVETRFR